MAERKGVFPKLAKDMTKIEKAILCLKSGGVVVDLTKKVQTWVIGMPVNSSMIKAGSVLDALMIPDGNGSVKPEWRTKWIHSATCQCDSCAEHILQPIRKHFPQQKKAAAKA